MCGIFHITLLRVTVPVVVVAFSFLLSKEVKSVLLLVKINSIREFINIFLKSSKKPNQYFKGIQKLNYPASLTIPLLFKSQPAF